MHEQFLTLERCITIHEHLVGQSLHTLPLDLLYDLNSFKPIRYLIHVCRVILVHTDDYDG